MQLKAIEVSRLNNYIKRILSNDPILSDVRVKGEISNLKYHSGGNVYLTLKDESSKLSCVMFKSYVPKDFKLKDGAKVVARGSISVFERDGGYQLYIKSIELDGIGELYIKFNQLKERLKGEGLFDTRYKKPIPKRPERIGILTSQTGAVIRDIINVVKRRYPKVELLLYPVAVQGKESAPQLVEGLRFFNEIHPVDVIIMGRGGGSLEELWSFNEESVAYAVFNSKIPVISAVGHETDFTICDFVADLRAPTPSAAAELAVPNLRDMLRELDNKRRRLSDNVASRLKLEEVRSRHTIDRIISTIEDNIFRENIFILDRLKDDMDKSMRDILSLRRESLQRVAGLLAGYNPLDTLKRGYSVAQHESGELLSAQNAVIGERISVTVKDGMVKCNVDEVTVRGSDL